MVKRSFEIKATGALFRKQAVSLTVLFLLIEFFDELAFGILGAALPAIRTDLNLTYAQIGLMYGAANLVSAVVEPFMMLLGDTRLRKRLVIGGGVLIATAMLLKAGSPSFPILLIAVILSYPASGAFVSLSQATLMDLNPGREPQMMARWTAAGSAGSLLGPLLVAGAFALAIGWRWLFVGAAGLALILVLLISARAFPRPKHHPDSEDKENIPELRILWENLAYALRHRPLMRWMVLLELSDLLQDVLAGYLTLHLTDSAGLSAAQASLIFGVYMTANLVADIVAIPLLERFSGRSVVRVTAAFSILVYAALLLSPWILVKIALLVILPFTTAGWYAVLQGEAYASIPGRSGTVMAVTSLAAMGLAALTTAIGWVAGQAGLPAAMWLLILGPVSLVLLVPHPEK